MAGTVRGRGRKHLEMGAARVICLTGFSLSLPSNDICFFMVSSMHCLTCRIRCRTLRIISLAAAKMHWCVTIRIPLSSYCPLVQLKQSPVNLNGIARRVASGSQATRFALHTFSGWSDYHDGFLFTHLDEHKASNRKQRRFNDGE